MKQGQTKLNLFNNNKNSDRSLASLAFVNTQRKSQITIFIILALVLALSIGTYVYFTSKGETTRIEAQRPTIQKAPAEFIPIADYVTDCLQQTAKTALTKIGEGGGYIDQTKIKINPFEPTEGEGIELSPGSELVVPFWWHLQDKNDCETNCKFGTKRLPIEREAGGLTIEKQIDDYINENINFCTNEFVPFKPQFMVNAKEPSAKTTIAKNDVFVTLTYPLTITKGQTVHEEDTFYVSLPVNFREIYNVATELTNLQSQNNYLEKDIRELIDTFSRVDKTALPPVSDLKFGFGIGTVWIQMDIQKKITELMTNYLQLLQVAGTRGHKYITPPANVVDEKLFEKQYNRGMIIPLEQNHPLLAVKYNYLDWWQPYVHIGGCRGQLCQPETMGTTIGLLFGIQRYNFAYDISLPVLVEINSPTTFKGEGYTFDFALEANLRDNRPMTADYKPLKMVAENTATSMFCDVDKRFGGELDLTIIDGKTRKEINDAVITYSCGTTSCALGTTINGKLTTKMPKCLGGVLTTEKYNYTTVFTPFDTNTEEDQKMEITIEPYRIVNFAVKKYLLKKGINDWEVDFTETDTNPAPQANDETTLITMDKTTTPYEEPFTVVGKVEGSALSKEKDFSTGIRLLPGNYRVRIYTIKYPKPTIKILPDKRCFSTGPFTSKKCVNVPAETIEFFALRPKAKGNGLEENPLPNGGTEIDLEITKEQLDKTKTIEWKVINFAIDKLPESDRRIEDLEQIGKLKDYAITTGDKLKPTFIEK